MRRADGQTARRSLRVIALALTTVWPSGRLAALSAAQSGGVLTALPGSTRSAALGGAGVALVGDAGAIFANPAGIATIRHLALEGSYEPYLGGTAISTAALALRVSRLTWGFGAQALDYGSTSTFHSYEALAAASLVYRRGFIAMGVTAKYDRQQLTPQAIDAWGGDAGMALAVFDIMAVGVSVQNFGGDLGNGSHLPRRTRAGITLNYTDPQGTFRLLTTLEGQWPQKGGAELVEGVEAGVVTRGIGFVGRLGYATRPSVTYASRVTFGAGVVLGRVAMDYAFHSYQALGTETHRVGLRWTP